MQHQQVTWALDRRRLSAVVLYIEDGHVSVDITISAQYNVSSSAIQTNRPHDRRHQLNQMTHLMTCDYLWRPCASFCNFTSSTRVACSLLCTWPIVYVVFRMPKIYAVTVAVKLQSSGKGWFLAGGDTPNFGHAFSNRTYFRTCGRFWLSSVQWVRSAADEIKQKIESR